MLSSSFEVTAPPVVTPASVLWHPGSAVDGALTVGGAGRAAAGTPGG